MDINKKTILMVCAWAISLLGCSDSTVPPITRGPTLDQWCQQKYGRPARDVYAFGTNSFSLAVITHWNPSEYDSRMASWLAQSHMRYRLSDDKLLLKNLKAGSMSYIPETFTVGNVRYADMDKSISFFCYTFPQQPRLDSSHYAVMKHYSRGNRQKKEPSADDPKEFRFAIFVNMNTGISELYPARPNNFYGTGGRDGFPLLMPEEEKIQRAFIDKIQRLSPSEMP